MPDKVKNLDKIKSSKRQLKPFCHNMYCTQWKYLCHTDCT